VLACVWHNRTIGASDAQGKSTGIGQDRSWKIQPRNVDGCDYRCDERDRRFSCCPQGVGSNGAC